MVYANFGQRYKYIQVVLLAMIRISLAVSWEPFKGMLLSYAMVTLETVKFEQISSKLEIPLAHDFCVNVF